MGRRLAALLCLIRVPACVCCSHVPDQVVHGEVLYISSRTGRHVRVGGALASSWRGLGGGYGTDGHDVYHAGRKLWVLLSCRSPALDFPLGCLSSLQIYWSFRT